MSQERPISPEKQLLNEIESPKTDQADVQAQAAKHQRSSLFSFKAWMGRRSFFKGKYKKRSHEKKPYHFNIKLTNRILGLFVFVLAAYFINDLYGSLINFKKSPDLEFALQKGLSNAGAQESAFLKKDVSYYLKKTRERNLFSMDVIIPDVIEVPEIRSSTIIGPTEHLRLVGISWSNDPDAMIEDTKTFRTFFVRRGQMIGDIKVQVILKDKVILNYQGEEIELK